MAKITKQNGKLIVPDVATIPFIEGDGVGKEITPVCQDVVNAAVEKAYQGKRRIEWMEVLAGGKAHEQTGEWLPQATLDAFSNYLVGIKGPLMTPVGGDPFAERGSSPDARPLCMPASGALFPWR